MKIEAEDFDDVQVSLAAIAYYLYKQAGCPLGDNLTGLTGWLDILKADFSKLAPD